MLKNADLLKGLLQALYKVTSRRTTNSFAVAIIDAITKTLEEKYKFLKYVKFRIEENSENAIYISSKVNSVPPFRVGQAIEVIVQLVYMDLKEKAGLYFITELRRNAGEEVISSLKDLGMDLELLQLQQHFVYRQRRRIRTKSDIGLREREQIQQEEKTMFNYSWENISSWKYEVESRTCILYNEEGEVLDSLDLDTIVKNYIDNLTKVIVVDLSTDYKREYKRKCLKLRPECW